MPIQETDEDFQELAELEYIANEVCNRMPPLNAIEFLCSFMSKVQLATILTEIVAQSFPGYRPLVTEDE